MASFYEGIAEAWWDSLDELQAAVSDPEGAEAVKVIGEDEAIFIDQSRSTMFVTEEHEIFDFTALVHESLGALADRSRRTPFGSAWSRSKCRSLSGSAG
jgi:hypothetical protein